MCTMKALSLLVRKLWPRLKFFKSRSNFKVKVTRSKITVLLEGLVTRNTHVQQANSENCGPPLGNKFDLEVGQRLPSRSQHGTTGKVLSQGTHMPSIKALSVIVQKLWPRLKFL